jgi:LacI family transcriptional regulator
MANKATIQDIARAAGVSNQTVSRVLNNRPDVADATRQRVTDVIQQMGYRPSDMARGLRNKNTRTIGLIIPDSANPFFAEIAKGVETGCFDRGYGVILCNSAKVLERELIYLDLLQSKGADGIIFIATSTHIDHLYPLVESGVPVALFYRDAGNLNVDTFKIDNFQAGYMATTHLLELGHTRIACIRPSSDETPSGRRVDGHLHALEQAGIPADMALMPRGDNLIEGGEAATAALLASGDSFSAIFAANDAMAIGAMRSLRDSGRRVPDDVSVIGVDDIMLAKYVEPPLTTIAQPKQEAGLRAIEYLIERVEERYTGGPRETLLPIYLVERRSCAPYREEA